MLELNETTKSLPPSSQNCFLPLSASTPLWATSWNVKWLVVMAGRRGASCKEDPGQGASSRRNKMRAFVKQLLMGGESRWPCRGPFCYKGFSHLQGQRVSPLKCYYWA